MANKKQVTKASNKIVYIFFGVGLLILLLVGFLYYQSQRPNYRDLEKAFNELTIPEGWQEVSSSSNKGAWGLFCWQIEGEECPYKIVNYSRGQVNRQGAIDQLSIIKDELSKIGYSDTVMNLDLCTEDLIKMSDYNCNILSSKNSVEVYYEINSKNPQGQKGNYSSLVITRKE
jgi:hypothetical protein